LCLALPAAAPADEVRLKGGGRVRGVVLERTSEHVVVAVGPGTITLPEERVERVVPGSSALATYQSRASRLDPQDLAGWLELARWARERELPTQARKAFEHVARLDPQNAEAQLALGRVRYAGRWVTQEDAYRAQGLVRFEGEWITMGERARRVREDEARRLARQEASARAREAEARARAAEAEAARAEAELRRLEQREAGIPLAWVYWGSNAPVGQPVPRLDGRACRPRQPHDRSTAHRGRAGRHRGSSQARPPRVRPRTSFR
jgi:hypothetical protein